MQDIIDAYSVGQRHFGENYVQELVEKASDPKILENCKDIRWHFIGHLQSNKIKKIIGLPGLHMVQTIDSEKLAQAVNNAWEKNRAEPESKLKVLIQVNTSAEDEKNGVEPAKVPELFDFITNKCTSLDLQGLMTIGAYGFDYSKGPNPDFIALLGCLDHIPRPESLELSFGMSDDFEKAVSTPDGCVGYSVWCFKRFSQNNKYFHNYLQIEMGSTIVRVGSSIFGFRAKKN